MIKSLKYPIKIDIVSDLHIDQWSLKYNIQYPCGEVVEHPFIFRETNAEYLIVAGDISDTLVDSIKYLDVISKFYRKVFFVDGNHEHAYYHPLIYPINYIKNYIDNNNNDKIVFLPKTPYRIDDTIIIGVNGWWDYDNEDPVLINKNLNYFDGWIPHLTSQDNMAFINNSIETAKNEADYLEECLEKYTKDYSIRNVVIVTHTIPLKRFCNEERIETEFNSGFERLLKYDKISHWIFGHTHEEWNEKYKGINFICNPMGRPEDHGMKDYSIKQIVI